MGKKKRKRLEKKGFEKKEDEGMKADKREGMGAVLADAGLSGLNMQRRGKQETSLERREEQKSVLETAPKEKIAGIFSNERVVAEACNAVRELYDKSRYGEETGDGKFQYSLVEALFLMEKGRMEIYEGKKAMGFDSFLKKAGKVEPNFWVRYCVFKDMRARGYIVKTALKFGADFRVYDRGVKPGEDHAKWVLFPVHEATGFTWYEFAAKNRVAHSTRKRLLLGIVDDEGDVTFYEIRWTRP